MASNDLMFNPTKTEFLWLSMPRSRPLISRVPLKVDGVDIVPNSVIHLLGVLGDEVLSFENHINHLTRSCYYQLQRIRNIQLNIPITVATMLTSVVSGFVSD